MRNRIFGWIEGLPPIVSSDGSLAYEKMHIIGRDGPEFRILEFHSTSWIHVEMEEERKLLDMGAAAAGSIAGVLQDVKDNWELRVRLAVLLGRIGDPRSASVLLKLAREDEHSYVRQACWIGLGLLRRPEVLRQVEGLKCAHPAERKALLWVRAMSGSQEAVDEYFKEVEGILAREELEDCSVPFMPKLWVSDSQKHLTLQAKATPETAFLNLDLWRLAFFRHPRTVRLLIDALRYHDSFVQHMAYDLLERDVEGGPKSFGSIEFDLHTLEIHSVWQRWWATHSDHLQWDETVKKYVVK